MLEYNKIFSKDLNDVKELLTKAKGNYSPQTIIDFLRSHEGLPFNDIDSMLIDDLIQIILYTFSIKYDELALILADEFKRDVDLNYLIYQAMFYEVDSYNILQIYDISKNIPRITQTGLVNADLFKRALTKFDTTPEYLEIFLDDETFFDTFSNELFTRGYVSLKPLLKQQVADVIKPYLKYPKLLDLFLYLGTLDPEILKMYLEEINAIFIF